ncbi:MAG: hypothetical protein ACXWCB_14095, partial [Acidimicrobiales bacterium]
MIDPDRSRRPSGFWRSLARPRRSARPGTMPAGLVLVIVVGALLLAMFGNADATLRKSEGKPRNAQWRTDVADRIASVSDFLHLTSPRSAVDSAMGRTSETKTESIDELLAQQQATQGDGGGTTDTTADLAALTPKIRTPTPTDPLTLWVGGDSVTETFGTSMV